MLGKRLIFCLEMQQYESLKLTRMIFAGINLHSGFWTESSRKYFFFEFYNKLMELIFLFFFFGFFLHEISKMFSKIVVFCIWSKKTQNGL